MILRKDINIEKIYDKGFKINDLFTLNNVGIVTARDNFTIHEKKENLINTIEDFLKLDDETARIKFNLGKDVRDWQVNFARKDLLEYYPNKGQFVEINYRPFDIRHTFYTGKSKGFHCYPRNELMKHFVNHKNLGLITARSNKSETCDHFFISKNIMETKCGERTTQSALFPLYLYPETSCQQEAFGAQERVPNLNMEIVNTMATNLGIAFVSEKPTLEGFETKDCFVPRNDFAPIDVLDYIYAVLHSPKYRETYKEFLKIDFPRVPYPSDAKTFWELVALGGELRQLHLLESPTVEKYITKYPVSGNNIVGKPRFEAEKVYINDIQYFDGVPQIAWNFYIGGYQPAQKWLKDRKDRVLTYEDIFHYQKMIVAMTETDRIMKEIDGILPKVKFE